MRSPLITPPCILLFFTAPVVLRSTVVVPVYTRGFFSRVKVGFSERIILAGGN